MPNRNSEINKLRSDIEEMSNRLMALTAEAEAEMESTMMSDRLRERWDRVKESGTRAKERVDDYAHDHPWQMIAAGAVMGFLLGFAAKRNRE